MKKSIFNLKNLLIFATLCAAFASLAPQTPAQTSSNDASALVTVKQSVINDCSRALDELAVYDRLLESKEAEIKLLGERLELEKERSELLRQVADARKNEAASLLEANNALKTAIAAKDAVIENKDREIGILKKKKPGVLNVIKAVAAGIAIGLVLK